MLTGRRDTDFIILSNLDDKDLLSVCVTNKYANRLCNIEDFWRNRFIAKWGRDDMKYKSENRSWKRFYLLIVKYLNGSENWNMGMEGAARGGHRDLVEFFISKGAKDWNRGMQGAARGGHRNLVDFFIGKGANYWNSGMDIAALGGHRDLVELFIEKGAKDWNSGMGEAAEGGHRDLIDFFINKGAKNWDYGMAGAAKGGHRDLIELFINKGANWWDNGMLGAAEGGHRDLVDFFISKGASYWNSGMVNAARGGHQNLVDFFISKGAKNWNGGMESAAYGGHRDLVDFFISKGAKDWNSGMEAATLGGHKDLANFFHQKMRKINLSPSMQRLGKSDNEIEKYLKNPPKSWRKMFLEQGLPENPTIKQVLSLLNKTAGGNSSLETETSAENPKNFTPPENVRKEALEGIRLSYENNYPSYNGIGLARAIQLVVEPQIWKRSVERMQAFFKRNHRFSDFSPTSKAYMAYLNWGGSSGEKWVQKL